MLRTYLFRNIIPSHTFSIVKSGTTSMRYLGSRIPNFIHKLNINKATLQQLVLLPGIGTIIANRIIDYRQRYGPFRNIEDLILKVGLHQKLVDRLSNQLEV